MREPVGSIAGSRSRLQPLAMTVSSAIAMNTNRPIGSGEGCERALVAAGWFICPSRRPTILIEA
jgi:hypothetical protein